MKKKVLLIIPILIVSYIIYTYYSVYTSPPSNKSTVANITSASEIQIESIATAIENGGTASDFKAVKSKDFVNLYFVSAIVTDASGKESVGLWAIGGSGGPVMSVNATALQFTEYPPKSMSGAEPRLSDDGAMLLISSY